MIVSVGSLFLFLHNIPFSKNPKPALKKEKASAYLFP